LDTKLVHRAYEVARERFAELGVDTETALRALSSVPLSLHCWQGDDVGGFERPEAMLSGGGILVTGAHPGRARNVEELRADLDKAFSLIPGRHRLNLHAMYGEFGGRSVDRDQIEPSHYSGWIEWSKERGLPLDFNATCFSHPKAESGFTLSHKDEAVRSFWMEHVRRCRSISSVIGRKLEATCIHNLWIPDGSKDTPVDRWAHRRILKDSLDDVYSVEYDPVEMKDSLESKLFGVGSECFVVGSHEFYLGYALSRGKMVCLDLGHFHQTESVADKVSAILQFASEILLHISRGVRWDSDHVPALTDDLRALMEELVRANALPRAHIALDFFDASLSRVGAWAVGARAALQALLSALLQPRERLVAAEERGDSFARMALLEEAKSLPVGAVWERYCASADVPAGAGLLKEVQQYEDNVTSKRI
jgi:L-rhamnose isomerase